MRARSTTARISSGGSNGPLKKLRAGAGVQVPSRIIPRRPSFRQTPHCDDRLSHDAEANVKQHCSPSDDKGEREGYVRRDNWLISFFPGGNDEIEEVTDAARWKQRLVKGRPLTAIDFCMTLGTLRELKAHGRVLSPDERFGLQILRSAGEI